MANEAYDQILTNFEMEFLGAPPHLFEDFSIVGFTLTESLLTPSITSTIQVTSYRHTNNAVKNWDDLALKDMYVRIERPANSKYGVETSMDVLQPVYRVSNRQPRTYQTDQLFIDCCDKTLLVNAAKKVSKSWKCTVPSAIVRDVLENCVRTDKFNVEAAQPPRTYFADNIHPFQVIAQQADVALAGGQEDPSFLHFMTFENLGTHHFRSLTKMTEQSPVMSFVYKEKGLADGENQYNSYEDPTNVMNYEFKCDFDILSDILNGIDSDGSNIESLFSINPFNGIMSLVNGDATGCGMGQVGSDSATNKDSAKNEGNCEIDVEKHRLKRQARLGLLEPEKVALRLTVPWNPMLNVGKMINFTVFKKRQIDNTIDLEPDYGSGDYLISAMTHHLRAGGFSTTVIDCVSKSVGQGGKTIGS